MFYGTNWKGKFMFFPHRNQMALRLICFVIALLAVGNKGLVAQPDTQQANAYQEEAEVRDKHTLKGGVLGHTNGYGITVTYGRFQSKDVKNLYGFDYLFSLKHPKEAKVVNPGFDQANPYVFSRKNALMAARFLIGQQRQIADKEEAIGVRIDFNYMVGPNLGLLKPVYIEWLRNKNNNQRVKETVRYQPLEKHRNQGQIYGGAPYIKGLGEIDVQPGISAKASLSFAWGDDRDKFKSIEAGIMADAYPRRMPIFHFEERQNKSIFVNLFATFSFGKHW